MKTFSVLQRCGMVLTYLTVGASLITLFALMLSASVRVTATLLMVSIILAAMVMLCFITDVLIDIRKQRGGKHDA